MTFLENRQPGGREGGAQLFPADGPLTAGRVSVSGRQSGFPADDRRAERPDPQGEGL